ncbi:MAG TPA: iron-containing alcohol dehydrogenase, partial [Thermodesulfobacteriota bacterium]|nr:iron-containing alcohol dehydrogenase [Thermodesulfobacteriota bacterium]
MNQAFYDIGKVSFFHSPKKVILGQNTLRQVGAEAKGLGGTRALIVTDTGIVAAGSVQIAQESLRGAKIESGIF